MANPRVTENIKIENAHILFRNFSGRESKYNRAGQRNFCVYIDDPDLAQRLIDDGWNIRVREPREEGEAPSRCQLRQHPAHGVYAHQAEEGQAG